MATEQKDKAEETKEVKNKKSAKAKAVTSKEVKTEKVTKPKEAKNEKTKKDKRNNKQDTKANDANKSINAPLIKQVHFKMPKFKFNGTNSALYNAVSITFAAFFALISIFSALSDFKLGIPIFDTLLDSNLGTVPIAMPVSIFCLLMATLGLISINKITDAAMAKKVWQYISKISFYAACFYAVVFISVVLGSILGFSRVNSVLDGGSLLISLALFAIAYIASEISSGKFALVRIVTFVAAILAFTAFIFTAGAVLGSNQINYLPNNDMNSQNQTPDLYYNPYYQGR